MKPQILFVVVVVKIWLDDIGGSPVFKTMSIHYVFEFVYLIGKQKFELEAGIIMTTMITSRNKH